MSELIAVGERILQDEQLRIERAALEAQAMAELRVAAPAILDLLSAMSARLAVVEAQVAANTRMVMATRIRRPVRDASGTIQYVVDEIDPPPGVAALAGA